MSRTGRLVSLMLLVLPAASAAAGLNLAWNNCYPSPGAASDMSFVCDDSSPGAGDANHRTFQLYGSVTTGFDLTAMKSWTATIDLQFTNPTVDPWWQLATGECREGGVHVSIYNFDNHTACDTTMMEAQAPYPAGLVVWDWNSVGSTIGPAYRPNRARLGIAAARTNGFNVSATVQFQLFQVTFDSRNTKVNGDGTTVACAGCLDPVCIVFSSVELDVNPSGSDSGKHFVTQQDVRQFVTWQGGTIGGLGCPAEVPVRRSTWGEVRNLYR